MAVQFPFLRGRDACPRPCLRDAASFLADVAYGLRYVSRFRFPCTLKVSVVSDTSDAIAGLVNAT